MSFPVIPIQNTWAHSPRTKRFLSRDLQPSVYRLRFGQIGKALSLSCPLLPVKPPASYEYTARKILVANADSEAITAIISSATFSFIRYTSILPSHLFIQNTIPCLWGSSDHVAISNRSPRPPGSLRGLHCGLCVPRQCSPILDLFEIDSD